MKLQTKLLIIFFSVLIIFGLCAGITMNIVISSYGEDEIRKFREDEMVKIKQNIKNYVDIAYNTIESDYNNSQDKEWLEQHYGSRLINIVDIAEGIIRENKKLAAQGAISVQEAQQRASESVGNIRYNNGTGYVWINDTKKPFPKMVMHPTVPNLDGTVLNDAKYNCALGKNQNLFQASVEKTEKRGEGFVDYLWPKPAKDGGLTKDQPKLSYVRLDSEWNWIIGTGIYVDDALNDAVKKSKSDISRMRYDEAGYFWINDTGKPFPKMIMHPTVPELNGKLLDNAAYNCALGKNQNLFQAMVEAVEKNGEGYVDYLWPKPTKKGLTSEQPKLSYVRIFQPLRWVIGTGVYLDSIDAVIAEKTDAVTNTVRTLFFTIFIVAAVVFLFLAGLSYYFTNRFFIRNINDAVSFAKTIADGDLTSSLNIDRKDEIGILAASLNNMNLSLREMVKTIINGVSVMSASSADLSEISEQMAGRAVSVSEKANNVATATEEMSANMNSVATASEQASANVKMVATSTEEMAATVNEIAHNSENARLITNEAVYQGRTASDKVHRLGNAANEISKVTEVITEVSEQTNLLALNATIEAARAGEAGKGFAVVANEIKELARQTPEATRDIRNKIEDIQGSTTETVTEIGQISDVINKVNEIVSVIATAVEEQSLTTREIAGNIASASVGIEEVNLNVAQSSSVAGDLVGDIADLSESAAEMSESISQVSVNAEKLSKLAAQLKEMADKFKV
ncbi:methyl-accepting chemotaxis protein [Desulfococcaceae bacterium HSG8]|nr:methyl-accepting chemotaxis protein [Desulfococcaceae bacterium HSG8]